MTLRPRGGRAKAERSHRREAAMLDILKRRAREALAAYPALPHSRAMPTACGERFFVHWNLSLCVYGLPAVRHRTGCRVSSVPCGARGNRIEKVVYDSLPGSPFPAQSVRPRGGPSTAPCRPFCSTPVPTGCPTARLGPDFQASGFNWPRLGFSCHFRPVRPGSREFLLATTAATESLLIGVPQHGFPD